LLSPDGPGPKILLALAVVGGLWQAVKQVPKIVRVLARVDTAARQIIGDEDHPGINERLKKVELELRPNGGGSMRDAVHRVEQHALDAKAAAATVADELRRATENNMAAQSSIAADVRANHVRVEALMRALDQYAQERWQKDEYAAIRERAYVRALKKFGLDLTAVAESLESEEGDDEDAAD
jgi:hypothetical protein